MILEQKIIINEILKIKNENIKVIKNLTIKILHSILYFSNKKNSCNGKFFHGNEKSYCI